MKLQIFVKKKGERGSSRGIEIIRAKKCGREGGSEKKEERKDGKEGRKIDFLINDSNCQKNNLNLSIHKEIIVTLSKHIIKLQF